VKKLAVDGTNLMQEALFNAVFSGGKRKTLAEGEQGTEFMVRMMRKTTIFEGRKQMRINRLRNLPKTLGDTVIVRLCPTCTFAETSNRELLALTFDPGQSWSLDFEKHPIVAV